MSISELIENVDNQIIKIRTKSLDVSFNELYDMYKDGELVISPDYQRLFRWELEKQSRFIESLILEMPVPPIFVIETDDGIYELIDGLQRISSYLHFRGEKLNSFDTNNDYLTDDYKGLTLVGCDIVKDLNGLSFSQLPKALQIKLKRSFVRMEVIKKESQTSLKYHMFKRLNTGGELLSAQEIRNCTIRLLGSAGIEFIEECSNNCDFQQVIGWLPDDKKKTKYDQELVLRFFAIKNNLDGYRYPVTEFLTKYLEVMTQDRAKFDFIKEKEIFDKTFRYINTKIGQSAFSGYTKDHHLRRELTLYYFDSISISIAKHIDRILQLDDQNLVANAIEDLKSSDDLNNYKTGSINGVRSRMELVSKAISDAIGG